MSVVHVPRSPSRLTALARRIAGPKAGLPFCPACGSSCVCPIEWEPDGAEHWMIQLHCGACDVWRDARVTNAEAKAFDLELDRQIASIERTLAAIERERMLEQADVFVAALERDLIDATDFSTR